MGHDYKFWVLVLLSFSPFSCVALILFCFYSKTLKSAFFSSSPVLIMDEADGGFSFDFEGGLDTTAIPSIAPGGSLVSNEATSTVAHNPPSSFPGSAGGNEMAPPAMQGVKRSFRQTVCRHWLRGLCMKGEACGFLHQYDKARMPICRFFRLYGECREQDCVYKHTNEDIKECNM